MFKVYKPEAIHIRGSKRNGRYRLNEEKQHDCVARTGKRRENMLLRLKMQQEKNGPSARKFDEGYPLLQGVSGRRWTELEMSKTCVTSVEMSLTLVSVTDIRLPQQAAR